MGEKSFWSHFGAGPQSHFESFLRHFDYLDDRQITHLICVRLRHLLYDFFWGVLWAFLYKKNNRKEAQNTP